MRVRDETIGALNRFRSQPGKISSEAIPLGQGMADIAAVALLEERALRKSQGVVGQLQSALSSRVVIEQAKGALSKRANIALDAAFTRLRNYARAQNLRLSDVAAQIIDGRLNPDALLGAATPQH